MLTCYETERLLLKILSPEHCHSVLHFYKENHEAFCPYVPFMPDNYYTADYQRSALTLEYNFFLKQKGVRFYIFLKEHPAKIIGTVSFMDIKRQYSQSALVGYRFGSTWQHKGYAFESMQKGAQIMFEEERLHRLEAFVQPDNQPSRNLLKRLGFRFEGVSYSHTRMPNGWQDMERYSLIGQIPEHS